MYFLRCVSDLHTFPLWHELSSSIKTSQQQQQSQSGGCSGSSSVSLPGAPQRVGQFAPPGTARPGFPGRSRCCRCCRCLAILYRFPARRKHRGAHPPTANAEELTWTGQRLARSGVGVEWSVGGVRRIICPTGRGGRAAAAGGGEGRFGGGVGEKSAGTCRRDLRPRR